MMALPDLSRSPPAPRLASGRWARLAQSVHLFRVWAPDADRVDLVLPEHGEPRSTDAARWRMPAPTGWWELEVPDAGPGTDYAFRVDGSDPLPDPRSAWQPRGVHGAEPGLRRRRGTRGPTRGWAGPRGGAGVLGAVFYELHVGTFTDDRHARRRDASGSTTWSTSASTSSS